MFEIGCKGRGDQFELGKSESWRGFRILEGFKLLEDKILIAGFFSSMDLLGFGMCRARILFRSSLGWNLMGKMLGSSNKKGTIKPKHQSSYLGFACSHSQSQSGRRTQFICTCSGLVKDWTTKTLKKVS